MASNNQECTAPNPGLPCRKISDFTKRQGPTECQPFLKSAIERYADRRGELDERQRLLNDKVGIMERSIPALMALSMLQSERGPGDALGRVRALMDRLAPKPDPADELAAELAERVQQLNRETTELHDKIINADVQLEENCMKLESLEQENLELENQIHALEKKLESCFSLGPISSNDRLCLAKIRKLGEEEMRLKRSIRDYEERELALRCQIEKILGPNDSKCRKICDGLQNQKHHVHRSKHQKKRDCRGSDTSSEVESLFERKKNCNTGCGALRQMIDQNGHAVSSIINHAKNLCALFKLKKTYKIKKKKKCKCQKKLQPQRRRSSEKSVKGCPQHGLRQTHNHLSRLCNCNKVKKRKRYEESEFDEETKDSAWHVAEPVPKQELPKQELDPEGTTILDVDFQTKYMNLRDEGSKSAMTMALSTLKHTAIINKGDQEYFTSQSTHTKVLNEMNNDLPEKILSSILLQDDMNL